MTVRVRHRGGVVVDTVSVMEAAKLLGLAEATVNKYARNGRLSAITTEDGRRRFDRREVETLPDRIREGHGPECPIWHDPFLTGKSENDCQCVSCHCTEFVPGGFLGSCQQCLRPLVVDGRVVR